jgi:hypothetical protein
MMPGGGPRPDPLAIVSLVLGILSVPSCCCWGSGGLFAIAAVVTGILGLKRIRSTPQAWSGGGMAIAGIVCGSIGLVMSLLSFFTVLDDQLIGRLGFHH